MERAVVMQVLGARDGSSEGGGSVDWLELLDQQVRRGLPMRAADGLKTALSLSDPELAALIGLSEKTLWRTRKITTVLDPVASDRLVRVARTVALAVEVLEDEKAAMRWLRRAQVGLGGRVPLDALATDIGREQVQRLLTGIEHGVYV